MKKKIKIIILGVALAITSMATPIAQDRLQPEHSDVASTNVEKLFFMACLTLIQVWPYKKYLCLHGLIIC